MQYVRSGSGDARNRTDNNSISYLTLGNLGLTPSHLYKLYCLLRSAGGILMNKMKALDGGGALSVVVYG